VYRGLRINVAKGEAQVVFVNDIRRNFARNNLAEDSGQSGLLTFNDNPGSGMSRYA
jgi:hypothetical protein